MLACRGLDVSHQVRMVQSDSLGLRGAARGELQKGRILRADGYWSALVVCLDLLQQGIKGEGCPEPDVGHVSAQECFKVRVGQEQPGPSLGDAGATWCRDVFGWPKRADGGGDGT